MGSGGGGEMELAMSDVLENWFVGVVGAVE